MNFINEVLTSIYYISLLQHSFKISDQGSKIRLCQKLQEAQMYSMHAQNRLYSILPSFWSFQVWTATSSFLENIRFLNAHLSIGHVFLHNIPKDWLFLPFTFRIIYIFKNHFWCPVSGQLFQYPVTSSFFCLLYESICFTTIFDHFLLLQHVLSY